MVGNFVVFLNIAPNIKIGSIVNRATVNGTLNLLKNLQLKPYYSLLNWLIIKFMLLITYSWQWGLNEVTGALGVLTSAIMVLMLWLINQKVAQNHARTKQIDHVSEIVSELNKSVVRLSFETYRKGGSHSGSGTPFKLNLFEISNYGNIKNESDFLELYREKPVLLERHSHQIVDIKRFIDHPLTPPKIANKLEVFYNSVSTVLDINIADQTLGKFVEIYTGIEKDSFLFDEKATNVHYTSLIEGNAEALKSFENLIEHSKGLKQEIKQWFKNQGIKEINLKENFKMTP